MLKLKQEYELQQKEHDLAILQKNWIITFIVMLLCILLLFARFRWFKKKKELELKSLQMNRPTIRARAVTTQNYGIGN